MNSKTLLPFFLPLTTHFDLDNLKAKVAVKRPVHDLLIAPEEKDAAVFSSRDYAGSGCFVVSIFR